MKKDLAYSREEIVSILRDIQDCVRDNRFLVSRNANRQENERFIQRYALTQERQKEVLLGIVLEDFCETLQNEHPGFEHEVLYVFSPQMVLVTFEGEEEPVDIYIKFNLLTAEHRQRAIIISLHRRNYPINYPFRS